MPETTEKADTLKSGNAETSKPITDNPPSRRMVAGRDFHLGDEVD